MNKKTESTTAQIKSNPARWHRLKNILADALEQTSFEKRTAVLRRSCADDTALLREAEKLLAQDSPAFDECFLQQLTASVTNRRLKFQKCSQLFIRTHNEALSVVAMRVNNPDCSPLRINS